MPETVNTYWAKFGIDSSDFVGGIGRAQTSFLAFYSQLTIAAEMSIQLIGQIGAEVKKFGDTANEIMDVSYQTGIATDKLQQYNYAAMLAGSSNEQMSTSLNYLSKSMGEATVATSAQARAFQELGVKYDGRSTDQVFDDVATSLVGLNDVTQRNRIANDLFGRSYKEVLPIMETYVNNLEDIKAHPVYNEDELKQLNAGKVAWEKLTDSLTIYTGKALAVAQSDPLRFFTQTYSIWQGMPDTSGKNATGGADWTNKEVNANILKDTYAGLTDAQIDLLDAEEALTKAQAEQTAALKKGDEQGYAVASKSVALYTNRVNDLKTAMQELNAETIKSASGAKWDNTSIVGTAGSEMYDYLMKEMESGTDYQTALQKWSAGAAHFQAGSLGMAKDTGASTASKAKKVEEENKKVSDATKAGYAELEKMTLIHETAEAEMSRVKYQALLDYAAEAVNWAGSHPIIQKSAVLTKNGYDIDISPLAAVTAPRLASADFSSVRLTGGAVAGAGGSSTTNTTNNIYVTTKDNPAAVASAVSQKLANQQAQGGTV